MGGSKGGRVEEYQEPEPVHRPSSEEKKLRDRSKQNAARAFGTLGTDLTRSGGFNDGQKRKTLG